MHNPSPYIKNQIQLFLLGSLTAVLFLGSPALFAESGFRTFTNEAGKTLRAKPIRLGPNSVTLELENGRTIKSGLQFFIQADRDYLKQWDFSTKAQHGDLFDIDVNRRMDKLGKEKDGPLTMTFYEGYYKVKISNKTNRPLTGIRAEYRTFSLEESMGKKDSDDVKYNRDQGTFPIAIAPFKTQEVETIKSALQESKLDGGYAWADGGDANSSAKMAGIWLRFYLEDESNTLLYEYALPSSLTKREDW